MQPGLMSRFLAKSYADSAAVGIMSQRNDASLLPIAILGKLISLIFKSLGTDGPTKTDDFFGKLPYGGTVIT